MPGDLGSSGLTACGGKASPGIFLPQTPHHVGGSALGPVL